MNDLFDLRVVIRFLAKKCVCGLQEGEKSNERKPPSIGQQALAYMPGSRIRLRTPRRERRDDSRWKNIFDSISRLGQGIYGSLERQGLLSFASNGDITIVSSASDTMKSAQLRWFQKVLDFRNELNRMVDASKFGFRSLAVSPIRKSEKEDRIIAKFTDLHEAALLACLAKYLTAHFDSFLRESACAFRAGGKGGFNSAAEQIRDFRMRYNTTPLYVAECDLKKFYDTVNHDILKEAFMHFSALARNAGKPIDHRAGKLLNAYLDCYSFKRSVLEATDERMQKAIKGNRIPWVSDEELRSAYSNQEVPFDKIGIPQGGAISPLLANIMLHSVDNSVLQEGGRDISQDKDFLYTRFCDDMVIISSNRNKCDAAFNRYCHESARLKLLMHNPKTTHLKYDADWWNGKTRCTYEWSREIIPWVGFVGYQIRYDGELRLRKQTFDKLNERLKSEIGGAICEITEIANEKTEEYGTRWEEILDVKSRTIAHVTKRLTGKPHLRFRNGNRTRQYCWADAFTLLASSFAKSDVSRRQIGEFDRMRNDWLNWFCRKVDSLLPEKLRQPHIYFGKPFSIFDAFSAVRNSLRNVKNYGREYSERGFVY